MSDDRFEDIHDRFDEVSGRLTTAPADVEAALHLHIVGANHVVTGGDCDTCPIEDECNALGQADSPMWVPCQISASEVIERMVNNHIATQSRETADLRQQLARYEGALDAAINLFVVNESPESCKEWDAAQWKRELLAQQDGTKDAASSANGGDVCPEGDAR